MNRKENGDYIDVTGKEKLLEEINLQAREEAAEKIAEAEKTAEQKIESTKGRIERIKREAEERAEERIRQIEENNASAINVRKKRLQLQQQEEIVTLVLDRVRKRCKDLIGSPEYRHYVKEWIVEAVIGLDQDEATVSVSEEEKPFLTDELLAEAEREVEEIIGKRVSLQPSSNSQTKQGVVVRSKDGRLEYNNQIETKLYRNQTEIRRTIYNTLR